MSALNLTDYHQPTSVTVFPQQLDSVMMECGRLIHAAVISKPFLKLLLADPVKSIETGFCGEKFTFTREEKQQINSIHASNLAEFSQLLLHAIQQPRRIPATPDMAFAHVEPQTELSA